MLAAASLLLAGGAAADPPRPSKPTPVLAPGSKAAIGEARIYFEQARAAYKRGEYRRAVDSLEQALTLDPGGKDLVFNLALVHEKLGEIDRALFYLTKLVQMEKDPADAAHAREAIHRLEGARVEVAPEKHGAEAAAEVAPADEAQAPPLAAGGAKAPARRRKVDAWVLVASGVAVAAAAVGGYFGVRALSAQPAADEATGPGRSIDELRDRADEAHSLALVADVAFAVSLASGAVAATLYFVRSPEPATQSARSVGLRLGGRF